MHTKQKKALEFLINWGENEIKNRDTDKCSLCNNGIMGLNNAGDALYYAFTEAGYSYRYVNDVVSGGNLGYANKAIDSINKGFKNHFMKPLIKVELTSIRDVFTDEEIQYIKDYILPDLEPHQCHSNAARFAIDGIGDYDISFIEGYLSFPYGLGHCWNKVVNANGDEFYVDLTTELVNEQDPTQLDVWKYDEWQWDEIEDLFDEYGQSFIPHIGFMDDDGVVVKVDKSNL